MHKAVILLVKAKDKFEAKEKADEFLDAYGEGRVFDWYQIGGRWTGALNPKYKEFLQKADEILKKHPSNKSNEYGFLTQESVDDNKDILQDVWEQMGQTGPNPYYSQYELPDKGGDYDIMPLKDCISVVREWQQDNVLCGDEIMKEAEELYGKNSKNGFNPKIYGYELKRAGDLYCQNFSFDTNLFNTETDDYELPEKTEGYFAVLVDMHV